MNLRQLEVFSALADELHFGRAALKLRVSQSALSQQLQKLENDLGVQLVIRTSREITLTEAGALLLEPARQTLVSADRVTSLIEDFKAGRTGRVVIGSLGAGLNGPLPAIIRRFNELLPGSVVELFHSRESASQERAVLTGEYDAAVVRRVANERSIESLRLLDETFIVYLPDTHPLAGRQVVSLADLASEVFVFWHRRLGATFYDLIVDGCRARGFEPTVHSLGDTLEAQLALVAAGLGVSVQAASHSSVSRAGTVAVAIEPEELRVALWYAYRKGGRSVTAEAFLRAACEISAQAG